MEASLNELQVLIELVLLSREEILSSSLDIFRGPINILEGIVVVETNGDSGETVLADLIALHAQSTQGPILENELSQYFST